jgi:hypothetical protein
MALFSCRDSLLYFIAFPGPGTLNTTPPGYPWKICKPRLYYSPKTSPAVAGLIAGSGGVKSEYNYPINPLHVAHTLGY